MTHSATPLLVSRDARGVEILGLNKRIGPLQALVRDLKASREQQRELGQLLDRRQALLTTKG